MNDLQSSAHMARYVDNSRLCSVGSTSENSQLQRSAQEADAWADDNLMFLNCDKTKEHGRVLRAEVSPSTCNKTGWLRG